MENYYFLILVAVVGVIRWLMQAAENKRNSDAQKRTQTQPTSAPFSPAPTRAAPQSEEERVRKFFEALGVPTSGTPLPRVQPRSVMPKSAPQNRKFLPVDPFPVPTGRIAEKALPPRKVEAVPPPLPSVAVAPAAQIKPLIKRETRPMVASDPWAMAPSGFDVQEMGVGVASGKSETGGAALAARLASPQGLRDAILLREIFGTPLGLQPLDRSMPR
ncbi:MAG: hypothetical protein ABI946_07940 [Chthoniobacterales bacterium]